MARHKQAKGVLLTQPVSSPTDNNFFTRRYQSPRPRLFKDPEGAEFVPATITSVTGITDQCTLDVKLVGPLSPKPQTSRSVHISDLGKNLLNVKRRVAGSNLLEVKRLS